MRPLILQQEASEAQITFVLKQAEDGTQRNSVRSLSVWLARHSRSAGYPSDERDVRLMLRPLMVSKPTVAVARVRLGWLTAGHATGTQDRKAQKNNETKSTVNESGGRFRISPLRHP